MKQLLTMYIIQANSNNVTNNNMNTSIQAVKLLWSKVAKKLMATFTSTNKHMN